MKTKLIPISLFVLFLSLLGLMIGCNGSVDSVSYNPTNVTRFAISSIEDISVEGFYNIEMFTITDTKGSNDFLVLAHGQAITMQPISRPPQKAEDDGKKK